ncbi:MAG: CvpA family protein [Oscillospiraceae bacterium]|nr:CvpA family protein [Oscillospiraceae bacterium]MDE7170420.1 CvpA family protein [Oscillospiraceae bacterium]
MPYLFDILIIAVLALFAWRGAAKGLILSLCGLAAILVAFFAAQFISDTFCAPVGNILRPIIVQTVRGAEPKSPVSQTGTDGEPSANPGYTLDELLEQIQKNGLFEGFSAFLEGDAAKGAIQTSAHASPLDALATYLAKAVARALLFGIVFFGGLLAWFLLSHALDLAFKLPILAEVNLAGGLIVGLIKGVLFTIVLVWLGQVAGVVPNPPETPILSLFTVKKLWELLGSLPA